MSAGACSLRTIMFDDACSLWDIEKQRDTTSAGRNDVFIQRCGACSLFSMLREKDARKTNINLTSLFSRIIRKLVGFEGQTWICEEAIKHCISIDG